ncbi:MAG: sigma-70 family RNA polymerase sigma factor, partial [Allobranchiibius sp.]
DSEERRLHPRAAPPPAAATAAGDHDLAQVQRRDELVHQYLGLARGIARRYTHRGVDPEDLDQVASMALVAAANRYDPARGTEFGAYATLSIHGTLKRYLRDHAWAVRPPRVVHDTFHQVTRATMELTQTLAGTPTTHDIAQYLGIEHGQVLQAQRAGSCYTATSLDALTAERSALPELAIAHDTRSGHAVDLSIALDQVIRALPARDQHLVRLRFEHDLTQQQIGDRLGISQMQVSRLLSSLIARLRTQLTHVA